MWNGKNKAVTFSFDDGVEQDKLGHAYEIDFGCRLITLEKFEKICEMLANHNDIYYGTNSQVLFEK